MPSHRPIIALLFMTVVLCTPLTLATPPRRVVLLNQTLTVEPGMLRSWNFQVSRGGARVVGKFRAQGGRGNDIECLILDEDGYENWRNGHTVNTYYNSGRITVATINVKLPPGHFFLVFNNGYSSFSNKVVAATIYIEPNEEAVGSREKVENDCRAFTVAGIVARVWTADGRIIAFSLRGKRLDAVQFTTSAPTAGLPRFVRPGARVRVSGERCGIDWTVTAVLREAARTQP